MSDPDVLLTVDEVVPIVRLHKVTIYRLARQGVIGSVKQGRQRRFPREEVRAYLARCTEPANAAGPASEPTPEPVTGDRAGRNPHRTYKT